MARITPPTGDVGTPPPFSSPFGTTSFAEIARARSDRLKVWVLTENPRVIVFDFPSLRQQGEAFNRVAALIEKRGAPRDRILSPQELISFLVATNEDFETFYYGHNYKASNLASFFNIARRQGAQLNERELMVRDVAMKYGVIKETSGGWETVAPEKAIVSVVQPSSTRGRNRLVVDGALRETILRHELSHGEFATNPAYRDYCIRYWLETMTDEGRVAFRRFLDSRGYDSANETLVINEFQAFLAHTPDERAFSAALLGMPAATVDRLQERFWGGIDALGLSVRLARRRS